MSLALLLYTAMPSEAWVGPGLSSSRGHQPATSFSPSDGKNQRTFVYLNMVSSINDEQGPRKRSFRKNNDSGYETLSESYSIADYAPRQAASWGPGLKHSMREFWMPVISASLLITGNTFGASSLALPQLVQGPGLAASSGVFLFAYFMNLLSGLIIAEVAIQQKESSGDEVPSSFKELVEGNLKIPALATFISGISFSVNALVFSFDVSRVGLVANRLTGGLIDASTMSLFWALCLVTLLSTQTTQRISNVASACVTVLFASFGSLLIPGLAHTDAAAAWAQPGLAADPLSALADLAPVILMAMVYQNMVPTVTRLHDYDRVKTATSMVLGSLIPLGMYLGWTFACLGGGIDLTQMGLDSGPLLAVFSLATLGGSSIGCGLSCASEIETFIVEDDSAQIMEQFDTDETIFELRSAIISVVLPLSLTLAVTHFGNGDLTPALSVAGGLGSPLLYGVLPVWMAWNQRQTQRETAEGETRSLVPKNTLGVVGTLSAGLFGSEAFEQVSHLTHLL